MASDWTTTGSLVLGCVVTLYIGRRALGSRSFPLPPGPPGLPWVGNVIGVDANAPWITYTEWARTYGDLIYSRLLGKDIIIINSEKVAKDLLEKRSGNYSDRPYLITAETCGVDFSTVFVPYGDRWRSHRRFFHQTFRLGAVARFQPYQHHKACLLLQRLLDAPEGLTNHVFEYTAAVIMNGAYNYDPVSRQDELVETVAKVLEIAVPFLRPDITIIVGTFPWLLRLPSWFPGMSFKKQMAMARECSKLYLDRPFEYSLQNAPSGNDTSSMVHDALCYAEENEILPDASWMTDLKEAAGSAFLAASETSNSFLMTFFLMMVLHPEVQDKGHAQIVAMVGKDRLPTIDDRPLLPFIDAILRETFRYSPVAPLLIPHAIVDDDVYEGFYLPKGATLLVNVWAMAHDTSRFREPYTFIPERFLCSDGSLKPNDVEQIAFGFGRRICVGRHFAEASVWSVMAKVLAVFKILKPLDENGAEVPVEEKFSSGVTIRPLPFKCRIVPRYAGMDAEKLEQLITANAP